MQLRLVLVAVAMLVVGGVSLSIARDGPEFTFADTTVGTAALLAAGWSLAAAGMVFAVSRWGNRVAWLLLAPAAAWFLLEWDNPASGSAPIFTTGLVLFAACPPLVGWLALAYPTGRLGTAVERLAVGASLVAAVVFLGLVPALFFDPAAEACSLCPDNLALVTAEPEMAEDVSQLGFRLAAATSLAVVAVAWWRLIRSSTARRRLAAPVVATVTVYLVLVAWLFVNSAESGFIGTGAVERRLWLGQAAALVALSVAVGWRRLAVRRTRSSLARLVVDLGEAARAGGLRHALANSLGDDSLDVGYPVGDDRFADATGHLVELPPSDGRQVTPIVRDGEPVAVVLHRRGLLDDPDLVEEVASAARLALDNERLQARLLTQEADLRASRARVVAASDTERRRLERDLHDGAQQRLIGLLIAIRVTATGLATSDGPAAARLQEAAGELQQAVDSLRDVAHRIHPAALTDEGLVAALDALAERAASPLSVAGLPEQRLPQEVESAVYRIVADTLRSGDVQVSADHHDGQLVVDILARSVPESVVELEDRLGALEGRLTVAAHDRGVYLQVLIPCEEVPCA
ncbi:MAG: histidine kinase [Actinomycetota bacterium]|nr:histidine kinase [Actinomycetota bacterium]